jgi:fibronectin type 3 domain-containing protein
MRGEVRDREVLLRWAPSDARAWKLLNEHGVKIERLTLVRNGQVLDEPEVVALSGRLKPEDSDEFIAIASEYSYAAIIAQAVFGDSFVVSGGGVSGIETLIAQSDELQQRFAISLYAADLCFPAALVAGWGFEDLTIRKNERYLYRVIPLVPEEEMTIEPGLLVVDTERINSFPAPLDFSGEFMDGSVLLSWDGRVLQSLYSAYIPERSLDGVNFTPITETPITKMDSTDGNDMIVYADSIANNVTYHYRLAGITPFGSMSAYSDTISGMGLTELRSPPFITRAVPDEDGGATIEWEFDPADEALIESFSVERSDDDKNFSDFLTPIDKTRRSITVPKIRSSNYFAITANSLTGNRLRSFSALVQTVDTLPPAVPVGLRAIADTTGIVRLSWRANSDKGHFGYRIYRGETADDELVPLNDIAHRDTVFVDSITLRTLNRSVYYAITALDERYNQSDKTAVVEVERPEVIPPTSPFIKQVSVENGRNVVIWVGGGESNLAGYDLLRQSDRGGDFLLLTTISDPESCEYVDSDIENNRVYIYRVLSRSKGGMVSEPSPDYKVTGINKLATAARVSFDVIPVVGMLKLVWNTDIEEVNNVQIYKKVGDGPYGLMSEGLAPDGEIEDRDVIPGCEYGYMIVVRSNDASPVTVEKRGTL